MSAPANPATHSSSIDPRSAALRLRNFEPNWKVVMACIALAFLTLPIFSLFVRISWAQASEAFASEVTHDALVLSLATATVSTLLVVIFGGFLAHVLARSSFRGMVLVDSLIDTPMVMPPMVTGLALLMFFGRHGPAGSILVEQGIDISFSTTAVIMAQVFVSMPFFVRTARAAFESMDPKLQTASLLLGASHMRTFFQVVIPSVWPSLLAGALLAWARALGEFGATLVFAGNFQGTTQTMPLAIYSALQDNLDLAVALSLILVATSFGLVALLKVVTANVGRSHAAP